MAPADIEAMPVHADVQLALLAQRSLIAALDAQIDALEERLQVRVRLQPAHDWLLSVPSIL